MDSSKSKWTNVEWEAYSQYKENEKQRKGAADYGKHSQSSQPPSQSSSSLQYGPIRRFPSQNRQDLLANAAKLTEEQLQKKVQPEADR